jgi:hypothetical protein
LQNVKVTPSSNSAASTPTLAAIGSLPISTGLRPGTGFAFRPVWFQFEAPPEIC